MYRWLIAIGLLFGNLAGAKGDFLITQWTFEGDVTSPAIGSGTASLVGTSGDFSPGNGGGRGWNTSGYASQSTGNGTRGVSFMVNTTGFRDISVSFDHRASVSASRWAQLDYTLDGANWTSAFWNNGGSLAPAETYHNFTVDLTSISGANNNPNFGFRIVSIFSPLAFDQNATLLDFAPNTAYMRANSEASYLTGGGTGSGNYTTAGTWRFDNVSVTAVPEPSSIALLSLVGFGGVVLRRFRCGCVGRLN